MPSSPVPERHLTFTELGEIFNKKKRQVYNYPLMTLGLILEDPKIITREHRPQILPDYKKVPLMFKMLWHGP
jgi:hypothetical protein